MLGITCSARDLPLRQSASSDAPQVAGNLIARITTNRAFSHGLGRQRPVCTAVPLLARPRRLQTRPLIRPAVEVKPTRCAQSDYVESDPSRKSATRNGALV